jgi:subtilisin family serine protease
MRGAFFILLALALLAAGGASGAVSAASQKKPAVVPGELIVGFRPGTSDSAQSAALVRAGAKNKKAFKQIRAHVVRGPDNKLAAIEKTLSSDPRVAYVEPNHVVSISAVPNDPSFSQLWGLDNTGQTGGAPDADIDAPEAWNLSTGSSSVVVAVVDTGVDFSHPDLAAEQWVNTGENCGSSNPASLCAQASNGIDDDGDGYVDDWRGWDFVSGDNNPFDDHDHGTHVSGTIGAVGNNGVGVAGVNWNVKIMALKFLDSSGSGDTAGAISATLYAADHGARIASNSWGGGPFDQGLSNAIEYGASKGMLFVAAAGNDGTNSDSTPSYPASYDSPAVVAVAATDSSDNLASFSNYGARSVDLAAPGVNILSTTPGNTYSTFSGTSMATPHVSGAAALVAARFPGATLYGTKAVLMSSVDQKASLAGRVATGGRLNVAGALSCANKPEAVLTSPADGFTAGVGDTLSVKVVGASCAAAAGLANVTASVNGNAVTLSAGTPDRGLYSGSYTVTSPGALTVTARVTAGGTTATQTASGTATQNYSCADVSDPWVDVTPGTLLGTASSSDDNFSALNVTFPFPFYGQTYSTAYVSSNGFLTLGSSDGAGEFANSGLPAASPPNTVIAPFWDDLNPAASGDVYAGLTGNAPDRVLHIEWYNVPHFTLSSSGTATFEVSLHETGQIVSRWLDTDLGNVTWNAGASATAGVENSAGGIGRQVSFNQPLLTSGRAVSCTPTATPPPSPPTITTTTFAEATNTQSYAASLAATGGTPPYTWSVESGALPAGISLNPSTGALSGTPSTAPGTYPFTARVDDAASQHATKLLSIAVVDVLSISTTSLPGGTVGQSYSQTLSATGGKTPYTWSVSSGNLPPGLTLGGSSAVISGTPTSAGSYSFTVQVADGRQTDTQVLSIVVAAAPSALAITTTSLPQGRAGVSYSADVTASGGSGSYTWTLSSGRLPPGLSLASGTPSATISGVPNKKGTWTFTLRVRDGAGTSVTRTFTIAVAHR